MATHVQAPDGTTIEFPDSMNDAAIEAAMAKLFPRADNVGPVKSSGIRLKAPKGTALQAPGPLEGEPMGDYMAGQLSRSVRNLGIAASPAIAPSLMAAPASTLFRLGAGSLAGGLVSKIGDALGFPGTGDLAGDITGAATAGPIASRALTGISGTIGPVFRADPRVAINRSLRPVPSDPGFPERIPQTLAAIKAANQGANPAKITDGTLDLIPATQRAIDAHQQALHPWLERARGVNISGDPIINATRNATAGMLPSEGVSAEGLVSRARQDYGAGFTPEALRARLALLNQRLSSYYNKAPGAQSAALADIPEAVLKAQRDAVADALYQALDPEGSGAGPRGIQQRTGDLIDLKDAALRRNNAIVAEQPLTPFGKLVDPLKGMIRSIMPGKATGAGMAFAEGSEGRSLPLIRRAFKAVDNEQPSSFPRPNAALYPSGNPQRALTTGDMITPQPQDSSFVRGLGVPPHQQVDKMLRALPSGSASFSQGVVVPDILGRPGQSTHRLIEGPTQPTIPTGQGTRPMPMPETSGLTTTEAARAVTRDPKSGRMKRYYTSQPKQ